MNRRSDDSAVMNQRLGLRVLAYTLLAAVALLGGLAFAEPVAPQPEMRPDASEERAPAIAWKDLSEEQRQLLSRFENRWDQLPPHRQRVLAKSSQHWLSMTPEQREDLKRSLKQLHNLNESERNELHARVERFKELPPDEQKKLRDSYMAFRHLSAERRKELRERWQQLTPEERAQWRQSHPRANRAPNDETVNSPPRADAKP